jgi:hypothetical protein
MKDHLLDLVEHTHDLGVIDLVKITGDDKSTVISGLAEDRSVVVEGQFVGPHADFIGTFGMPNLSKLKILLNLQEYRENADLSLHARTLVHQTALILKIALATLKTTTDLWP